MSKITNNWLEEEGTMSYRPFYFIFKNVLFFIYCTEQNTKEIISLRRCYLLIKTWRSILKWCRITMFLKQLSSSNNRLAPKTSVKVFCPAFWLIPLPQQNSKLNSPSTIYKPTTIYLGKLNDCKKTCFFFPQPRCNYSDNASWNIRQILIGISCRSAVSKLHICPHHLLTWRLVLFGQFAVV